MQGQADHTGQRYIGILIYCKAGETCPMDLQLASKVIGRVEPARHDNRLHLIVVDQPVDFMGEMEIFRLTAPGPGAYRIEAFVLLHERPEPSSFAPEIQNVTIRKSYGKDTCYIDLHVLTSRVCRAKINFQVKFDAPEDDDYDFDETSGPSRLHNISTEFGIEWQIIATIAACDESGATASRTIEFSTIKPEPPETDEVIAPVELIKLSASDLTGMPQLFGVPLAQGALYKPEYCYIQAGAERIPALPQVWARWPRSFRALAVNPISSARALGRDWTPQCDSPYQRRRHLAGNP